MARAAVRRDVPSGRREEQGARATRAAAAPVLALQQAAGNRAVAGMLGRAAAFDLAASGSAGEVPRRAQMEAAFGTGFGDVRARRGGPEAEVGLDMLGARAAARGNDVVFREADPSADLIAHELAHVVQQRRGRAGVACRVDGPARPTACERAAEAAGAAVATGRPVPDVGAADADQVQLAPVSTVGGQWNAQPYDIWTTGSEAGAQIDVSFDAAEPIEADKIALVQTVKTDVASAPKGPMVPAFKRGGDLGSNEKLSKRSDGTVPGTAIDQRQDLGINTSPVYTDQSGTGPKQLTDSKDSIYGQLGKRLKKADGSLEQRPARLNDWPRRDHAFPEQTIVQSFEVAALALDGPFANLYLGSIRWGWRRDWVENRGEVVRKDPLDIEVVRDGSPSAAFADASKRWNEVTLGGQADGGPFETVDLPIATDEAGALSTEELALRVGTARGEAATATGADAARKGLAAKAFEREYLRRNLLVRVAVSETEDPFGDDQVFINLKGPKGEHRTGIQPVAETGTADFLIPLSALTANVPFGGLVVIDAFEQDPIGRPTRVVSVVWSGAETDDDGIAGGAKYHLVARYQR